MIRNVWLLEGIVNIATSKTFVIYCSLKEVRTAGSNILGGRHLSKSSYATISEGDERS